MEEHWIYEDGEKRRLKPFHGILLFCSNGIFLYHYCLGADEMGHVRTGADGVIPSGAECSGGKVYRFFFA